MSGLGSCEICKGPLQHTANLCKRCGKLVRRGNAGNKPDRRARIGALKQAWDGRSFRCHYSGVRLVDNHPASPRYLTFDHRTPGHEDDIVIAAALINDMKSDTDEDEFKRIVKKLANHFRGGPPVKEDALDRMLRWKR